MQATRFWAYNGKDDPIVPSASAALTYKYFTDNFYYSSANDFFFEFTQESGMGHVLS